MMHASMKPPLGDLEQYYGLRLMYPKETGVRGALLVIDIGPQLLHEGWTPGRDGIELGLQMILVTTVCWGLFHGKMDTLCC